MTLVKSLIGIAVSNDLCEIFTHIALLNQRPPPPVEGVKKIESGIHIGSRAVLFERGSEAWGLWELYYKPTTIPFDHG